MVDSYEEIVRSLAGASPGPDTHKISRRRAIGMGMGVAALVGTSLFLGGSQRASADTTHSNKGKSKSTSSSSSSSSSTTTQSSVAPTIKHFLVVWGENSGDLLNASVMPWMAANLKPLACTLTQPSNPNYLAAVSGSTQGVTSDGCNNLSANTIAHLVSAKDYAENKPSSTCPCNTGTSPYDVNHVPFAHFTSTCDLVVDFAQLQADVTAGTLPKFAWISPNIYDCGHTSNGTTSNRLTQFDNWVKNTLWPVVRDRVSVDTVLFVSVDTGANPSANNACASYSGGLVGAYVVGPASVVKRGTSSSTKHNHYDLLATVERALGVGNLGGCDATANAMTEAFSVTI
jgi:hypothetical protein